MKTNFSNMELKAWHTVWNNVRCQFRNAVPNFTLEMIAFNDIFSPIEDAVMREVKNPIIDEIIREGVDENEFL